MYREAYDRIALARWATLTDALFAEALETPPKEPEWVRRLREDLRRAVRRT